MQTGSVNLNERERRYEMKTVGTWCAALLAGFLAFGAAAMEKVAIRDNSGRELGTVELDGIYTQDELNRKIDEVRDELISKMKSELARAQAEAGQKIRKELTSCVPYGEMTFYYDPAGYLTGSAAKIGDVTTRRDAAGAVIGSELVKGVTTYCYDANGRLTGTRVVSGNAVTVCDATGRMTSRAVTTGALTTCYDASGRVAYTGRKEGYTTTFRNPVGYRISSVTEGVCDTVWRNDIDAVTATAKKVLLYRTWFAGRLADTDDPATLHLTVQQSAAQAAKEARFERDVKSGKIVLHYNVRGDLIGMTRKDGNIVKRYDAAGGLMGSTPVPR